MRTRTSTALAWVVALSGTMAMQAMAVEPETGIYWALGKPGEGLLIERQGDQIGMVLYTYSADGEPEFYVAGGPLVEGGVTEPVGWTEGYFPLHSLNAPLFRTTDGPRFNSIDFFVDNNGRELKSTEVGSVVATFQYNNVIELFIRLNEFPANGHPLQRSITSHQYFRTPFGFRELGTDTILQNNANPLPCWIDLTGTWAFVDMASEQREVWGFDFALEEVSPPIEEMTCPVSSSEAHVLVYKDSVRKATMRCVEAPSGDPRDGRRHIPGCEVTQEGVDEPLFFFYIQDIGLKRIVASRGAFPPRGSATLRTSERVVGLRVD